MDEFLKQLNDKQIEAVKCTEGPLLILAGAGSGKTRVIIYRIAHLLKNGVPPWNILAMTFTNKAANQMKERITMLADKRSSQDLWISTYHSFGAKILRIEAEGAGLNRNFTIYDDSDSKKLVEACLKELNLDTEKYRPSVIANVISSAKDKLLDPESYSVHALTTSESIKRVTADVYEIYQKKLKAADAMDFGDILRYTVELFKNNPRILEKYQERFRYIMIDEYQDTNYAQYVLCKKLVGLAGGHRDVNYTPPAPSENLIGPSTNLFVVGDDDQSIYEWRGADIRNILFFEKDFPNCKTVKLVKNYRSTANIITAANEVFKGIKEKHLIKQIEAVKRKKDGSLEFGDAITVYMASDETDEINFIVFEMNEIRKKNPAVRWNDFAVLYRVHEQSKIAKRVFENQGIPYIVYNPRFWQLREVQDICSYLKVLAFYLKARAGVLTDAALSKEGEAINDDIKRMYYLPPLNFSPIETEIMSHTFKPYELFTNEEMRRKMLARLPEETSREKFLKLVEIFSHLADDFKMSSLENTVSGIIESCDYLSVYKKNVVETEQSRESVRYVMAVREEAVDFDRSYGANIPVSDRLSMFLENIAIRSNPTEQSELKTKSEYVNLMSLHAAKGLEFNTVFFIGLEENIIPIRHYSAEKLKKKDKERRVDEERRLFYVGITRAKERLYLTYADSRLWYSKKQRFAPSRFLACLPKRLLDRGSFNVGFFSKMKYGLKRIFS